MPENSQTRSRRQSGLGALVRRIHFYAGMFIGPFLFVAAVSGALYAVAPSMESVVYRDILRAPESNTSVSLEEQVRAAHDEHPDLPIAQIWPSSEPGETTRVLLSDESVGEKRLRSVFVDPATAEVVGDEPTYSGLGELPMRFWISSLHENLHLGDPGALYSEMAASWMWFVALGGAYLWWRRTRSVSGSLRGIANTTPGSRKRMMNWHGVAGAWLLVAMIGLSITGITWSNVAGQNVSATVTALNWKAEPIATELAGSAAGSAEPLEAETIAAQSDRVVATAREEGLTGSLRLFPGEDTATAWQASERWVPYRLGSDAVSIDGANGEVVDRLPFAELPVFSKLTSWGIYMHMGIMFGLPLQILLCVAALAMAGLVVTGYVLWWKRRPTVGAPAGVPGPRGQLSGMDWAIIAIFLATVGTFLPLFGASLLAMLIVDRILVRRAQRSKQRSNRAAESATPRDREPVVAAAAP
ncbi:PepSY domain-containing protein [Corynebacterium sp. TAE3-ERU30]|uniref:PepSY-associated TM helix domain-containing protein n=1 Tax=Corynebacterium sp. TAE3-ERU30 TaxID=2849496 RepID=UPI001C470327|nr:PepSY domain-containing protein [Corynebacterium sp. TAE3-ERU30]MBV7282697.1 PepSY domain-containing protein [Corynebacterium sp. TAE3-ERU30]